MNIYIEFNDGNQCGNLVLSNDNCCGTSYIASDNNGNSAIKNALQAQIHAKVPGLDSVSVREMADVYIAVMLLSNLLSKKGVIECADKYLQVIRELFPYVIVGSR